MDLDHAMDISGMSDDDLLQTMIACGQVVVADELDAVEAELELLRAQQAPSPPNLGGGGAEQAPNANPTEQQDQAPNANPTEQQDQAVVECCQQVLGSIIDRVCALVGTYQAKHNE